MFVVREFLSFCFFFFNDTATTESYTYCHTLTLHDALPIARRAGRGPATPRPHVGTAAGHAARRPRAGERGPGPEPRHQPRPPQRCRFLRDQPGGGRLPGVLRPPRRNPAARLARPGHDRTLPPAAWHATAHGLPAGARHAPRLRRMPHGRTGRERKSTRLQSSN